MLLRLPDHDLGPFRVGDHGHATGVQDVVRIGGRPTSRPGRRHDRLCVVGPDVGVPGRLRRRAFGDRTDGRHVAAPDAADVVGDARLRRHDVLDLPTEKRPVEAGRGVGVGLTAVGPAGDTGDVAVSLGHGHRSCSLVSVDPSTVRPESGHPLATSAEPSYIIGFPGVVRKGVAEGARSTNRPSAASTAAVP